MLAGKSNFVYGMLKFLQEISWLGIFRAGAKFLEVVAVYVNINKYGYVGW